MTLVHPLQTLILLRVLRPSLYLPFHLFSLPRVPSLNCSSFFFSSRLQPSISNQLGECDEQYSKCETMNGAALPMAIGNVC